MTFAKHRSLLSPTYLAFVRSCPCFWFGAGGVCTGLLVHAHHWPPKGRLGYTDDSRTLPACGVHHSAAHGSVVNLRGKTIEPISEAEQERAVNMTMRRFLSEASALEHAAFFRDVMRWHEQRGEAVVF